MKKVVDYAQKLHNYKQRTFYLQLEKEQQLFLDDIAYKLRLTFQEFRQLTEASVDLNMWGEPSLQEWWSSHPLNHIDNIPRKVQFINAFREHMAVLKSNAKQYPTVAKKIPRQESSKIVAGTSERTVFGECPVQSPRTVCCNLKTIDAVESCVFGCSYCTIQTF